MKRENNGNTQLNTIRSEFNDRVENKTYLGNTVRVKLNSKRRYRTI